MLEPVVALIPALVAQSADAARQGRIAGDYHATFTGRDLLVGVKGKHRRVPHGAYLATAGFRAQRFAGIFDDQQPMAPGDIEYGRHLRRHPEGVYGNDGAGTRSDRFFNPLGIDVERLRIDIDEHRRGAFVADSIGHCDERERGQDHLVTLAYIHGADTKMQAGSA